MYCSRCLKSDVCKHRDGILKSFDGIIKMVFGPRSEKRDKIDEFIGEMCEKGIEEPAQL